MQGHPGGAMAYSLRFNEAAGADPADAWAGVSIESAAQLLQ